MKEKPVFKTATSRTGEILLVWTNPPGLDAEFTIPEILQFAEDFKGEALQTALNGAFSSFQEIIKKEFFKPGERLMAPYAWKITKDYHPEPDAKPGTSCNAVGLTGPRNLNEELFKGGDNVETFRFRLYCDDYQDDLAENRIYEGELFIIKGEDDEEAMFSPLGDFGMPNAGCSTMAIFQEDEPRDPRMVIEKSTKGFWVML